LNHYLIVNLALTFHFKHKPEKKGWLLAVQELAKNLPRTHNLGLSLKMRAAEGPVTALTGCH
jgi:hypothetical protein